MNEKEKQIEALLKEYDTLREEMKMYLNFLRRDMQLTLIVIGVVASVWKLNPSSDQSVAQIVAPMVIPSILFVLIMSFLMTYNMVSIEAKACARIEKKVNELVGLDNAMAWESAIVPKYVRDSSSPTSISSIIILVFLILLFLMAVFYAQTVSENIWFYCLLVLHALELIAIVKVYFGARQYEKGTIIIS